MNSPCDNCLVYSLCSNAYIKEEKETTSVISLLRMAGRCHFLKHFLVKCYNQQEIHGERKTRKSVFNPFRKKYIGLFEADWIFLLQIPE